MKLKALLGAVIISTLATAEARDYKKIKYKKTEQAHLELHIFTPEKHKASDSTPGIVFFNGGGFQSGGPSQFYEQARYLSSRGMVAVCAEYRTIKNHKTGPTECLKDAKSAMRYVRSHAKELGINPEKLAAGGGSAGGYLATAVATISGFNDSGDDQTVSCVPSALVLYNPVFNNEPKANGGWGHGHAVKAAKRANVPWQKFSPAHNISSKTPPAIVMLGDKDDKLPVATCEKFKQDLEAKGVRCDLHVYKDQLHSFFNKSKSKEHFYLTLLETDKFLTSLGYLSGAPTLVNE